PVQQDKQRNFDGKQSAGQEVLRKGQRRKQAELLWRAARRHAGFQDSMVATLYSQVYSPLKRTNHGKNPSFTSLRGRYAALRRCTGAPAMAGANAHFRSLVLRRVRPQSAGSFAGAAR